MLIPRISITEADDEAARADGGGAIVEERLESVLSGRTLEEIAEGPHDVHRAVAAELARREPERYTDNVRKVRRAGRIFIDYLRNGRGATWIAPFSTRARDAAPVSVPVAWEELGVDLRSEAWNVGSVRRRLDELDRLDEDPWEGIDRIRQSITREIRDRLGIEGD